MVSIAALLVQPPTLKKVRPYGTIAGYAVGTKGKSFSGFHLIVCRLKDSTAVKSPLLAAVKSGS